MTQILKRIWRGDAGKYTSAHYMTMLPCHGSASPRVLLHRVGGMAFNFSAIKVPEPKKPGNGGRSRVDGGSLLNVFGAVPSF